MRTVMLLHKSVVHDSRVRREARALAEAGHEVTVLELAPVEAGARRLDGFARRSVLPPDVYRRLMPFQLYRLAFAASFVRAIRDARPEVIHAHDAAMLLPGLLGARLTGAALVYDSHELATGVPYRDGRWAAFVRGIERLAVPRCAAVITVSDGIAARLRDAYGLPATPAVVRNVPDLRGGVRDGRLREALGVGDVPLVLHQGSAAPGRGVEVLVRALARVPDAHLAVLGATAAEGEALAQVAAGAGVGGRVHTLDAVPVEELLTWTAGADVGVSLLQDTCDNHRLALPNKLFEYLAAGLPVVVSNLPELRRMVTGAGVGWPVAPADPDDIARGLRAALAARDDAGLRERVAAASAGLRWDSERGRLLAVYEALERRTVDRLAHTYARYADSAVKQRAWSRGNAGTAAMHAELRDRLLAAARPALTPDAAVLDVGCGTGWLLRALRAEGVRPDQLNGVDLLAERVEDARSTGAAVHRADASRLPFADRSFDLVFLISVLSSLTAPGLRDRVMREVVRVLRPGGLVLIYDNVIANPRNPATCRVPPRALATAGLTLERVERLTLAPPLARRLPARMMPALYRTLTTVPVLTTHALFTARSQ